MNRRQRSALVCLAISTAAAMPAVQAADDSGLVLEEIVVTAQKRTENLQEVSISVTAFSGEKLKELGFTDTTDIIKQSPGVNIYASHPSNSNTNIRGVSQNDFADHLEAPVAVYFDEGYIGASGGVSGQMFDMDRVEVLRGPQGTLFGRNATGGLLHYISKAPTTTADGYFDLTFGQHELVQFEGGVGGPVNDRMRYRISAAGVHDNGYVKNFLGPNPANRNNASVRFQLAYDITDNTEMLIRLNGNTNQHEHGLESSPTVSIADGRGLGIALPGNQVGVWPNLFAPPGVNLPPTCAGCDLLGWKQPSDPLSGRYYSSPGKFDKDVLRAQVKLTSKFDSFNFTSISDMYHLKKNFTDQEVDGTPHDYFVFNTLESYDQYSEELRLDGDNGKFSWVTGLYLLRMQGHYGAEVDLDIAVYVGAPLCGITPGAPACDPNSPLILKSKNDYTLDVTSWAPFAQGEYKWSESMSTILGVRYTHDEKKVNYTWSANFGFPTFYYGPGTNPNAEKTFQNVSLKLAQNWKPMDGLLLYASYSRGHKGGNWALPSFPPPITAATTVNFPHKQEVLTDYEIGLKSEFWGRRARFNVGAFYYDYKDYQAFSLAGLAQAIFNKDATASGGEAEFSITPIRGLEISVGAAVMSSKVKNIQLPTGDFTDTHLPFAANFSWNSLVRYEWPAFNGMLSAQASLSSVGAHYATAINEPINYEPRYYVADARVGYETGGGHWSTSLWVKNLNDERYRLYSGDISVLGIGSGVYAPGRWFGVTFGYKM
jgi:iron complex outermembrane recepter protein